MAEEEIGKIERIDETFHRLAADEDVFDWESRLDCVLNPDNVTSHLFEHTATYRKWALLSELAERQFHDLEDNLEAVRCDCRQRARQSLETDKVKITEDRVKELAVLDPAFRAVLAQYRQAQHVYERFHRMENAMFFSHRAMLQSINARQVRERSWDPTSSSRPPNWDDAKTSYQEQKRET